MSAARLLDSIKVGHVYRVRFALPVTVPVIVIVHVFQSPAVVLRQLRLMLRLVLLLLWWRCLSNGWSLLVLRHWRSLIELLLSIAIRLRSTSCGGTWRNVRG